MSLAHVLEAKKPTHFQQFLDPPTKYLDRRLYNHRNSLLLTAQHRESRSPRSIKIVCTSDTHNNQPTLPEGDILIHAGDLTQTGTFKELQAQLSWLTSQPPRYKVIVAGNHDILLDAAKTDEFADRVRLLWGSVIYLANTTYELMFPDKDRIIRIYGSPYTRKQGNWAFQYEKGEDVFSSSVPPATDILVTHMPPKWYLDLDGRGDEFLFREVERVRPRLHVFGHIHAGHGRSILLGYRFAEIYQGTCAGTRGWFAIVEVALLLMWAWLSAI